MNDRNNRNELALQLVTSGKLVRVGQDAQAKLIEQGLKAHAQALTNAKRQARALARAEGKAQLVRDEQAFALLTAKRIDIVQEEIQHHMEQLGVLKADIEAALAKANDYSLDVRVRWGAGSAAKALIRKADMTFRSMQEAQAELARHLG